MTTTDQPPAFAGVVHGMPHDEYLRHPALSASGAKLLVQPGGPARFRHEREHPEDRRTSDAFDFGHAAHAAVLGVGPGIDVVMCTPRKRNGDPDGDPYPAPDYKSKSAQEHRDAIRALGRTPALRADLDRVERMAAAIRAHPIASRLITDANGDPEVSLFWHDAEHGVDRRGRVDWLRRADGDGRLILVDYKTTTDASPSAIANAVARYGYHMQGAWYRDLAVGLGIARSAPFVFVFQEVAPPYLVNVVELDADALLIGQDRNARALRLYADCTASGVWPGYGDDRVNLVGLPRWALYEHEQEVLEA